MLEYVAFRGFNEVFRALNAARADVATRRGAYDATFATDALLKPIQTLDHAALLDAWDFLSQRFFRRLDAEMTAHAQALERGVYRAYCVAAVKRGERQKATQLLTELARRLGPLGCCIDRSGKLDRARSRLYRSNILQAV